MYTDDIYSNGVGKNIDLYKASKSSRDLSGIGARAMTFYGTCNFVSIQAANRYYKSMGYNAADVDRKLSEGEIIIGKPETPEGMKLMVNGEGRYVLCEM